MFLNFLTTPAVGSGTAWARSLARPSASGWTSRTISRSCDSALCAQASRTSGAVHRRRHDRRLTRFGQYIKVVPGREAVRLVLTPAEYDDVIVTVAHPY